ncbi:HNH endonuclease, partial [Vibrio parahaemolyticus]|uniref:HNH endonuclease n=1 Tax=Vibrio parahaemolyticus TaxID=670 RepID=UPI0011242B21
MYDKNRPSIPAELRRSVLVRAGHGCEISGCPEKAYVEIHHIDCNRENNVIGNLIALCGAHHRMAHEGKIDRKSLASYIQKNESLTYTHADEVARVLKFLDKIKACLTEYGNGYPEPVGSELYYFFTKSVYVEMFNF